MTDTKTKARGQMQPFSEADVKTIRTKLAAKNNRRDAALFETGLSTMLRGSDLLALTVADVLDKTGAVAPSVAIRAQRKTDRPVTVQLSGEARKALAAMIQGDAMSATSPLFCRDDRAAGHKVSALTTTSFRTMVKTWADLAGYSDASRFSGHSMRRTRATYLYRKTRDIKAVSTLLGHESLAHTSAYLALSAADAVALAEKHEL